MTINWHLAYFVQDIRHHIEQEKKIKQDLVTESYTLIELLLSKFSFREISRAVKLSPTYLNKVYHQKYECSMKAFLQLWEFYRQCDIKEGQRNYSQNRWRKPCIRK